MRGLRLNGWQRIGIVLSVVWLFVGAWWGLSQLFDPVWSSYRTCVTVALEGLTKYEECKQNLDRDLAMPGASAFSTSVCSDCCQSPLHGCSSTASSVLCAG